MLRRIVIRRLLIVIPVVLALALAGLFLPAREVSIEPYGRLSLGYEVAYASPAAPTYETFNEGKATGTSVTVTKPTDTAADDILIGCLSSDGGSETHTSPESDSWNVIYKGQSEGSGKQTFSLWWKTAGGSEPADYTFGCGSSEGLYAWVIRVDGAHLTDPIHKQNIATGDSDIVSCPAVTTTVDDCLIIRAFGIDHIDVNVDGGWGSETNITVDKSGDASGDAAGGSAYKTLASKGDSGAETNTLTDIEEWVGVTVAIQPPAPDISNPLTSKSFGTVANNTDYWSKGSAPTFPLDDGECFFAVTNNSTAAVNIVIKATNFSGGVGWTLGTPAENVAQLKAGKSGDLLETNMVTLTTGDQSFITGLAASASKKWEIKLETPTSVTDGVDKTSTVTLTATFS